MRAILIIAYLTIGLSIMNGDRCLMYANLKTVQLVDTPGKRLIKKATAPLIQKVTAPFRYRVSPFGHRELNMVKLYMSKDSIATEESIKALRDSSKSHR